MFFLKNRITFGTSPFGWNICFVFVLLFGASCHEHKPVAGVYYNIDSLLDRQISILLKRKATLEKNAIVGEKNSSISFAPADSAAWAEELELFRNLHVINKPVNRGLYKDSVRKDKNSNLTIRSFTALKPELPIERIEIFYLNVPQDIRKIEAAFREENIMFKTTRQLRMDFRKRDTESIVSAYSVDGGQKMLLGDTVRYSVAAKISIPQH
jgi:hypothetical protein